MRNIYTALIRQIESHEERNHIWHDIPLNNKEAVINRAREIGASAAARAEGVSYPTVLTLSSEAF